MRSFSLQRWFLIQPSGVFKSGNWLTVCGEKQTGKIFLSFRIERDRRNMKEKCQKEEEKKRRNYGGIGPWVFCAKGQVLKIVNNKQGFIYKGQRTLTYLSLIHI